MRLDGRQTPHVEIAPKPLQLKDGENELVAGRASACFRDPARMCMNLCTTDAIYLASPVIESERKLLLGVQELQNIGTLKSMGAAGTWRQTFA